MSRNPKDRRAKIRTIMAAKGKRARGAANIVDREQAARQNKGNPPPPPPPPTPQHVPGELTPLTFTCLLCQTSRDLPIRDFASGTILCPNHEPPRKFAIPDNGRYRRLAHEIDAISTRQKIDSALNARRDGGVSVGLVAVKTEPYVVLYRFPRVEVAHVQTWETKLVAVGHWNGPGNPLVWENPMIGNFGTAVLHVVGEEREERGLRPGGAGRKLIQIAGRKLTHPAV
jgi:hypothetical protein